MVDGVSLFIKRHVMTWMIMASLIFFGWFSYRSLGISEFPDVDFPIATIDVNWEGASPELNEIQVVDPIENAISSVEGIKRIYSSSKSQSASITAEFDMGTDIDVAIQGIQSAIFRIQRRLPRDMDPPVITKTNPEDRPILWITFSTNALDSVQLMALLQDRIRPQFTTIKGVADVMYGGFVQPNLKVDVFSDRLKQYDLTVLDVVSSIQQEHNELPGGKIEAPLKEWNVRTYGEALSVVQFKQVPVLRRGGSFNYSPIVLGQLAHIDMGPSTKRTLARSMGKTTIGLGFRKQRGVNAVEVADAIKARMKEVQEQYKDQLEIGVTFDSTKYIKDSIHEMLFVLVLSALLTSVVCWLFLGSWGATFNVILAIPTAIVGSFIVVKALNFTLNTYTLMALSLAIGIVVDDAIMVLENITRHRQLGEGKYEAAVKGTKEIFFAVLATTASLIAVFLPVIFVDGIIGKYLFQFGFTLSVAVALSMIEALTITPMRCAQMLELHDENKGVAGKVNRIVETLKRAYARQLTWVLGHRKKVLFFALAAAGLGFLSFFGIKKEFMPYQDTNRIILQMRAPLGVSVEVMDAKVKEVEAIVLSYPELNRYFAVVGGADVNTARMFMQLKDAKDRPKVNGKRRGQFEIANSLRKELKQVKGVKIIVQDNSNRGFLERKGFPIEMSLKGPDWNQLVTYSIQLQEKMAQTKQLTDIDSDYREGLPELQIYPNRDKAQKMGVSVSDINKVIQTAIGGFIVGQYTHQGYRYDIRVRLLENERQSLQSIKNLFVRNIRGELVPLDQVVEIKENKVLQEITRENRERSITLTANLAPRVSQEKVLTTIQNQAKALLPKGYRVEWSGSSASFKESFGGIFLAMFLGFAVAYMVLASQFNSFRQPLIVFSVLPFSFSGAFLALFVAKQSLNIYSFIGLLLVSGIVLKNSIMLVDFTNHKRKEGLDLDTAILEASPLRLRPIIMTALATIVGALPAALAFGPGAEARVPMALTVIGGVLVSTVFSLFVVPCLYRLFYKK